MRKLIALTALALVIGCDTGTEPREPFRLQATGPSTGSGTWFEQGGFWFLTCAFELEAAATGDGYATWSSGESVTYDPKFGPTPRSYSAEDLVDLWGSSRITGGETRAARIQGVGTDSYRQSIQIRYALQNGEVRSFTHVFDCSAP
jgi:hypothetical protein